MADCPTCGDSFDTESGMKVHHKRIHGESIAGVDVECEWCGDTTNKSRYQMERDDHHFCSDRCAKDWRTENFTGENNPAWKGGMATVECAVCGTEKEVYQAIDRAYDVHWCSKDCEAEWKSEHHSGEDAPAYRGALTDVECDYCGTMFSRYWSQIVGKDWTFCTPECRLAFQQSGTVPPIDYGPNWREVRQEALEEHGRYCQRCGMTEAEHMRVRGISLHVHHTKPVRRFDSIEEANQLDNLEPLCAGCHGNIEVPSGGFSVSH